MNDTASIVEQHYHRLLMQKSGEERLRMACSMFDAARAIVKSSIREKFPDISAEEIKEKIFLRFYGHEFNEEQRVKIFKVLK